MVFVVLCKVLLLSIVLCSSLLLLSIVLCSCTLLLRLSGLSALPFSFSSSFLLLFLLLFYLILPEMIQKSMLFLVHLSKLFILIFDLVREKDDFAVHVLLSVAWKECFDSQLSIGTLLEKIPLDVHVPGSELTRKLLDLKIKSISACLAKAVFQKPVITLDVIVFTHSILIAALKHLDKALLLNSFLLLMLNTCREIIFFVLFSLEISIR